MRTHLLVGTDGGEEALGALRLARALVQKRAATADVLSVVRPDPSLTTSAYDPLPTPRPTVNSVADATRYHVWRQLAGLGENAARWPVVVKVGEPAATIAETAREKQASLILLGLRAHGRPDSRQQGETTLEVVHLSRLPVLAVAPATTDLPRRILIAIDLHDQNVDAALALLEGIGDLRTIHLAHIASELGPSQGPGLEEWKERYLAQVAARLRELADDLRRSTTAKVEVHVPTGDADEELLDLAARLDVDLIVTGSHGYGYMGRAFTRSVSTALVHGGECSVLIAPSLHSAAHPSTPGQTVDFAGSAGEVAAPV